MGRIKVGNNGEEGIGDREIYHGGTEDTEGKNAGAASAERPTM